MESNWTTLIKTLHHEERMAATREFVATRRRMRAMNRGRLQTAQAMVELAIGRNENFEASRHYIETAIANLQAALPDALHD